MIQTASARPFVAEIWVRSRPSSCVISGTQSGTGTGFSPSTSVSAVSITAPMLHVHLHPDIHVVRRTGGRSLDAFKQSSAVSDIG